MLTKSKKNEHLKLDVLNILMQIYSMWEWQLITTIHDEGDGLFLGAIIIKSCLHTIIIMLPLNCCCRDASTISYICSSQIERKMY